jgi:hypothetical protein
MTASQKQKVVELLKSVETGDAKPVAYINPNNGLPDVLCQLDS